MPSLALHQAKDALKPQSHPLSTLEQLKKWSPLDKKDTANRAQPLRARPIDPNHQQLVVCHDMAGGYKEDKDVQGNNYKKIYHLDYWQYVDTFIYFSHERVAIPPVQWINACHANGVRCLGTFLVEDERGADELLEFLHGPPDATIIKDPRQLWNPFYPDKLVDIAVHYGFDGWLINVESSFFETMPPPVFMAQQLSKQVNYLREALHMQIPDSLVLWYDSMTTDGVINYQNTLNASNAMFFDASDGIYLNYWWKNTTPSEAVQEAKDRGRRAEEVYFGTDVWGRKTYGGGQFNSYKGVQDAMEAGASSVLFGTAWTYEYFSGNKDFDDAEFKRLERLFWLGGQNEEFPIVNVTSADDDKDEKKESHVNETVLDPAVFHPGVGAMIRPAPSSNWFATWFDRGLGDAFYFHGQVSKRAA
ncbi:glycoside hydrolase [Gongronella butleri]|nr:glycoside hydrolase [Gongronella butleri]